MDTQTSVKEIPGGMEVTLGKVVLRIAAFDSGVIRFRYSPDGKFGPDESFAVVQIPASRFLLQK